MPILLASLPRPPSSLMALPFVAYLIQLFLIRASESCLQFYQRCVIFPSVCRYGTSRLVARNAAFSKVDHSFNSAPISNWANTIPTWSYRRTSVVVAINILLFTHCTGSTLINQLLSDDKCRLQHFVLSKHQTHLYDYPKVS